jgi:hypothetical protein
VKELLHNFLEESSRFFGAGLGGIILLDHRRQLAPEPRGSKGQVAGSPV